MATLVAAATCAGAAVAAATLTNTPKDLNTAPRTSEIAVGQDHFDDARNVQLYVSNAAPTQLFAPAAGKVTTFPCAQGTTVISGGTPLALDGVPKLALATATPLWRDLSLETRGDDVRSFQNELARLGFSLNTDGVMGQNTLNAAKVALARIGITQELSVIPAASIVWIPAATVTVAACDTSVGADVQQGAALASFTSVSPNVSIVDQPMDLLPGDRIVKVGDTQFQVDSSGDVHVQDVSVLGVGTTPNSSDSNAKLIDAQIVLADPVTVSVVPPSAVYDVQGADGCVSSKGVGYHVHILGSQLGETLVNFTDGKTPKHVDTPANRSPSCT